MYPFALLARACFVEQVASGQLGLMISAVSSLVVAFGLAFVSSWKLTLADLVFVPLLMAAGYAMGQTIKGSAKRFMDMTEHGEKVGHGKLIFSQGLNEFLEGL